MIHHYLCAHVDRSDAFARQGKQRVCPKCQRALLPRRQDWEVIGKTEWPKIKG